ncbi:MAG TPA: hypothetical protein VLT90_13030 [Terriglobales bacterium]|nr:hypothetical protein [Terriglobales bacterium]
MIDKLEDMLEFTLNDVVIAAAAIIQERGWHFVYNPNGTKSCDYVMAAPYNHKDPQTFTGCLVGAIAKRLGCTLPTTLWGISVDTMPDKYFPLTPDARKYLTYVQAYQDVGHTWGYSADAAWELINGRFVEPQSPPHFPTVRVKDR